MRNEDPGVRLTFLVIFKPENAYHIQRSDPVQYRKCALILDVPGVQSVGRLEQKHVDFFFSYRVVFFKMTGRNNNEETRVVENGPLLGSVIVAYPTSDAPFTYFVDVYKRTPDSEYSLALRYRGHTGYGDGNPLAVIDSEMAQTLRLLGLWKTGDALPVPPRMPGGCTRLVMRKGVEWCEPH